MPRLPVSDVLLRMLGRQLGGPSGPLGSLVARMLNKGNGPDIGAAVGALDLTGLEEVAGIGFGGGFGLDLLLDQTRDGGQVHGVEPSPDMLKRARKAHHEEVAAGRLVLHEAGMESLPFAEGALDGWISVNTLYFVQDLPPAFAELRRVLAPTGRGVLGIADPDSMAQHAFTKYNFTVRSVSEVVAALTPGWSVGRATHHAWLCALLAAGLSTGLTTSRTRRKHVRMSATCGALPPPR